MAHNMKSGKSCEGSSSSSKSYIDLTSSNVNTSTAANDTNDLRLKALHWDVDSITSGMRVHTPPSPKATPPSVPPCAESDIPAYAPPPPAYLALSCNSSTSSRSSTASRSGCSSFSWSSKASSETPPSSFDAAWTAPVVAAPAPIVLPATLAPTATPAPIGIVPAPVVLSAAFAPTVTPAPTGIVPAPIVAPAPATIVNLPVMAQDSSLGTPTQPAPDRTREWHIGSGRFDLEQNSAVRAVRLASGWSFLYCKELARGWPRHMMLFMFCAVVCLTFGIVVLGMAVSD